MTIPLDYRAPKYEFFSVIMWLSTCSSPQIYSIEVKQRGCDTCYLQTRTINLCFPTAPILCFPDQNLPGSPAGSSWGVMAVSLLCFPLLGTDSVPSAICWLFLILLWIVLLQGPSHTIYVLLNTFAYFLQTVHV